MLPISYNNRRTGGLVFHVLNMYMVHGYVMNAGECYVIVEEYNN